jgi:hypothetical protein
LSPKEGVELFDSIDCLDIDELSELYAIAMVGLSGNAQELERVKEEASAASFHMVGMVWNNQRLGSALQRGCDLLGINTI